jgi:hypothetical protein
LASRSLAARQWPWRLNNSRGWNPRKNRSSFERTRGESRDASYEAFKVVRSRTYCISLQASHGCKTWGSGWLTSNAEVTPIMSFCTYRRRYSHNGLTPSASLQCLAARGPKFLVFHNRKTVIGIVRS